MRPPVLAKGSREISLMTAVDPFNHRFAWAAKGFRSSTGLICLKLNNIAIENNPSRMIVSRKNFYSNTSGFRGVMIKASIFLNFFTSRNSNKIKFFEYEQTFRKLNPNQTLIGSVKNLSCKTNEQVVDLGYKDRLNSFYFLSRSRR